MASGRILHRSLRGQPALYGQPFDGNENRLALVADSDGGSVSLWEENFRHLHFHVLTASDGENALFIANEFSPTWLFLN